MNRPGPLSFIFGSRKRNSEPATQLTAPAKSDVFAAIEQRAAEAEAVLADDILLESNTVPEAPTRTQQGEVTYAELASLNRSADSGVACTTRLQSQLISPVFIVGSPRSGTSILINAMIAAGYTGFREGNFLTLMRVFEVAADRHEAGFGKGSDKVMATMVDWTAFKADIAAVFKRHVDALNPESPWMDKSGNPEMIEAIPEISRLWPTAVFIFAKRRGIENIASRLKKFPGHGFEYHCRDWAKNMSAWRKLRAQLGNKGIEVDQQEIVRSPRLVSAKLADFLGADDHARQRIVDTFTTERPQETDAGSAARVIGLSGTGWTADQKDTFLRLCWEEMESFHYSLDETYWTPESSNP